MNPFLEFKYFIIAILYKAVVWLISMDLQGLEVKYDCLRITIFSLCN